MEQNMQNMKRGCKKTASEESRAVRRGAALLVLKGEEEKSTKTKPGAKPA